MQITEATRSFANGTTSAFWADPDASPGVVACFLEAAKEYGWRIRRHPDTESLAAGVFQDQDDRVLHLYLVEDGSTLLDSVALSRAPLLLEVPRTAKAVSTLKSSCSRLDPDEDAGSSEWADRCLAACGLAPGKDAGSAVASVAGTDPMALLSSCATLRAFLGAGATVTLDHVEKVLRGTLVPGISQCLDDLLSQRPVPLLRRLEGLDPSEYVTLFRRAAEDLARINLVHTLESSGKRIDQVAEELSALLPPQSVKGRYARYGRTLKQVRIVKMLAVVNKAEEALRTTRHDRLLVAQAFALEACRL